MRSAELTLFFIAREKEEANDDVITENFAVLTFLER